MEGTQNHTLAPMMISRRWLSASDEGDWDCGGAHPDGYNRYRLFDLTTGAEVELLDWFLPRAVKREHVEGIAEDSRTLEPAFRTFLLTGWRPAAGDNAECAEVLRDAEDWTAGLTRDGFVFSPQLPHVVTACAETFTVGFDRIRPWLKPEGVAAVAALRAERH
jgi:ribosome modulation factor